MALTDLIEADLLATLDGETDPQAVLDRYAGSKGPLYAALARATVQATARFRAAREQLRAVEARRKEAAERADQAEARAQQAERRAAAAAQRRQAATDAVARQQALLDQAQALRQAGFDDESLAALARVFAEVAQAEGTTPAAAVARFLKAATDFEGLAAFERQVRQAAERAKKAEAEAQQRERAAKVRTRAVDQAERFVRRGITADTIGAWQAIATQLELPAERLARGLAAALERFGSLEAACQAKARERETLDEEIGRRRAVVAQLQADQDRIRAALQAVATEGTDRLAAAEEQARAALHAVQAAATAAVQEAAGTYQTLLQQAAALGPAVRFAQALWEPHGLGLAALAPEA